MTATPQWFGRKGRELFGWLHVPEGGVARGGVVLAPPLGIEEMSSHSAYRRLALALVELGLAVLRFDYEGTGDSTGDLQAVSVEDWVEDVSVAVETLRDAGVSSVAVVGLRLGALLSALACARHGGVDALVLWDPVPSGRAFLRQQQALLRLSVGASDPEDLDGGEELVGMVLPPPLAAGIGALNLNALTAPLAGRVLVLSRTDPPRSGGLARCRALDAATWDEAPRQEEFLEVLPNDSVVPVETITHIADWLGAALPPRPESLQVVDDSSVVFTPAEGGTPIRERAVVIGPAGLFAIVTEPLLDTNPATPVVVFLNAGLLHHIGPSRLWVELARLAAAQGLRACRLDLSGIGDSGERPGQRRQLTHPPEAIEDLAEAVSAISPDDPANVVFVGLCSGAYHAVEGGITFQPRGACLINPVLAFTPPELREQGVVDPRRRAVQPYNALLRRLQQIERLRDLGDRLVPTSVWSLLNRLDIQPSPARGLLELTATGVHTLLVCGEPEARSFTHRARRDLRQLTGSSLLTFEVINSSDHSLFGLSARKRASAMVLAFLSEHFACVSQVSMA